jgi:hypothetical protein
MSWTTVVAVGLQLAAIATAAAFVAVVVRSRRRQVDAATDASGVMRWQAHVFPAALQFSPSAQWVGATYGRLELSPFELCWYPGAGAPWRAPVGAVAVRAVHGFAFLGEPSVDLDIVGVGSWRIVVSGRTVNRFLRNDVKRAQQGGSAQALAGALLARGARDLRGRADPPS